MERFESYLPAQLRDNECWEWQGYRNKKGYGRIASGGSSGRMLAAHRVAWAAHNAEPVPPGLCVCHHCDNPACVNPAHLFLGTSPENTADMIAKGRAIKAKGEAHGSSRLTEAQVLEARRLHSAGGMTKQSLSDRYGVSRSAIYYAVTRKTWRHLP